MYEQYLQLSNIPCGAVLNRIMTKEGISQSQLAERSGIVRQRICDYLANRRRITVEASLNLEKALRIGIEGFFYRIQANHDIYTCVKEQAMNNRHLSAGEPEEALHFLLFRQWNHTHPSSQSRHNRWQLSDRPQHRQSWTIVFPGHNFPWRHPELSPLNYVNSKQQP